MQSWHGMESFVLFRHAIISFIMKELCPLVDITCAFVHIAFSTIAGPCPIPTFCICAHEFACALMRHKGGIDLLDSGRRNGQGEDGVLTACSGRKITARTRLMILELFPPARLVVTARRRSPFGVHQCDWRIRAMYDVTPFCERRLASSMQIAHDSSPRNGVARRCERVSTVSRFLHRECARISALMRCADTVFSRNIAMRVFSAHSTCCHRCR